MQLFTAKTQKMRSLKPSCRRLFAELQEGPRRSADPTSFAEALNLDRSIQQVAHFLPGGSSICARPQGYWHIREGIMTAVCCRKVTAWI